ncbi:MAG: UxaA family hydrolase, partial [Tetragenococcus halophilus]|nr:UxaA family hydrolase [Tetragenococcus halophilus]
MSRKQNAIKVDERDNVCTVVTSTGLSPGGVLLNGVKVLEEIPYGHKVALSSIKKDEPIIRYGETIGYANATISEGGWINEDKMHVLEPVDIANYSIKSDEPDKEYRFRGKAVKKRYFMGYLNKDGTAGTRNILAINTTVQCTEGVVNKAVEKIKQEILPKYPNVDDVIAINHIYGCGIAIDGENADIPKRTIRNIAENPNFGEERLVVSLGCEKLIPQGAFNTSHLNENDNLITLQDYKGFDKMMDANCNKAEVLIKRLNKRKRVLCDLSHLVIGLQCGGSDALSGVTANPAIGYAADLLVQHKAKVMFSEVTEVRDAVHS